MRLSIRGKLFATFGVVVLLILLLSGLSLAGVMLVPWNEGDPSLRDMFTLQAELREGAESMTAALAAGGGEEAVRRIAESQGLPAERDWMVATMDGRIIADARGRSGQRLPVEEVLSWHVHGRSDEVAELRLNELIHHNGQIWGLYLIDFPSDVTAPDAAPYGLLLLAGPLLGLGISLLLFWLFGRDLVRPVQQLSGVVGRIASGDLKARTNLRPRKDELGQLAQDIDRMAARLEEAQARAAASDQARRYLVAAVSHDLRTPLTALLANVEAIRTGVTEQPDQALAVAQEKGLALKRLIDDLFELAALDAAPERWQTVRTDLAELTRRAVVAILPELEAEGMEVEAEIPEEEAYANLAPGKLERVLDNLLANARKYGASGRWLGVRLIRRDGLIRVEVADRGAGIPAAEREQVFERFYRTDAARTSLRGGAGLGLAVAREIVQRHGGRIGVENEPEGGVRFWFEVPAA